MRNRPSHTRGSHVTQVSLVTAAAAASQSEDKRKWQVEVLHVQRVKAYAPRVAHVVADIVVRM